MAELADALASGASGVTPVQVQLLFRAREGLNYRSLRGVFEYSPHNSLTTNSDIHTPLIKTKKGRPLLSAPLIRALSESFVHLRRINFFVSTNSPACPSRLRRDEISWCLWHHGQPVEISVTVKLIGIS